MVKKFFKFLHSEISGVHQAAILLGVFTFASQLLALVRDRMLAHSFGASQTLDIYYASFRIPDFIFASVASLVSISVLIPFLSHRLEKNKNENSGAGACDTCNVENFDPDDNAHYKAENFLNSIFTVFILAIILVSVIAWIFMPFLIRLFFRGGETLGAGSALGDGDAFNQIVTLSRLLLLQPICLGVSNMLGVVTQIKKRFFLYAASPILYNLSIIFGIWALYPIWGIKGVVWGVVIGGALHFIIQVPFAIKQGMLPRFTLNINFKEVKEVLMISIPRTITLSSRMLELLFIVSYASAMSIGSIAIFNLANNLQSVPLAIVGVSYTLAAFPTLSACFAKGRRDEFMRHIITSARHIVFWSIPISVLFIVLRAQIVRTILGSGSFNWDDTRLTAACLALFVFSLVAQSIELLIIRAYYAAGRTRRPLIINMIGSFFTILTPWVLLQVFYASESFRIFIESLLRVQGLSGTEVLMLPLGFTVGTLITLVMLWRAFEKDFGGFSKAVSPMIFHSLGAGVIGGFATYLSLNIFDDYFTGHTLLSVFTHGLVSGSIGIVVMIIIYMLLGTKELGEVAGAILSKINKNKLIVSEPDQIEV